MNKDGVVISQGSDLTGIQHYGTDTARDGNILYVYYAGAKWNNIIGINPSNSSSRTKVLAHIN